MLEKADFHGPVQNYDAISLENGVNLLKSVIENDNFMVTISLANSLVCLAS